MDARGTVSTAGDSALIPNPSPVERGEGACLDRVESPSPSALGEGLG